MSSKKIINYNISIYSLNNINILFKNSFKNLINQVPTYYFKTRIIILELNTF